MSDPDRYSRQALFAPIGPQGQARLREARVVVVGCGALGSHSAEYFARAGVGFLRLVDRDVVEWSNLHRQLAYEEADAKERLPKAAVLAARLSRINSEVEVEPLVKELNHTTALSIARGCDLLIDGTDNLPARFLLNDLSYRGGVPWIYAGAIGSDSHVQFFSGTSGPCLRCQIRELPPPGVLATCDTAGIIAPAAGVAASWQVAWGLRYLVERDASAIAGRKALFSLWKQEARLVEARPDPQCRVCVGRCFDALDGESSERATVLCGRRAVQVRPAAGATSTRFDLGALASRLESQGKVERNPLFLRWCADGFVLTVFGDGRAVFDGLTDTSRALSLYARFIGQ